MTKIYALRIDIFEEFIGNKYPVVSHIFYGSSEKECVGYFQAHLTTDVFLRDIYKKGKWDGVRGRYTIEWV